MGPTWATWTIFKGPTWAAHWAQSYTTIHSQQWTHIYITIFVIHIMSGVWIRATRLHFRLTIWIPYWEHARRPILMGSHGQPLWTHQEAHLFLKWIPCGHVDSSPKHMGRSYSLTTCGLRAGHVPRAPTFWGPTIYSLPWVFPYCVKCS